MLDHFIPGHSPRAAPPLARPPVASTARVCDHAAGVSSKPLTVCSAGLETGRIYDRDVVTLGPALDRLGNAWVRRAPHARGRFP